MKILLVHNKYLPIYNKSNKGAIEKLVRLYLEYNETKKDEITVYSPKIATDDFDDKKLQNTSFRNIDLTTSSLRLCIEKVYFAFLRRITFSKCNRRYISKIVDDIKKKHEEDAYDIIIFENEEQDIPFFRKRLNTQTKVVEHLHNDYINKGTNNVKRIVDSCDEIWTVSNFLAARVKEAGGNNVTVVPNTIEYKKRSSSPTLKKQLERKYCAEKNKIFLYVGRLIEQKGIIQLLDAFSRYSEADLDSELLLVGSTENNKGGKRLEKTISDYLSLNQHIHCVGFVDPSAIIDYQRISDYQIIPSMWEEAFGLVVLEAMSANLKIIASESGGIPEICKNKVTYVDRDNIVNELVEVLKKTDKKKLPDDYYSDILEEYSEEKYYINLYDAIHGKKD